MGMSCLSLPASHPLLSSLTQEPGALLLEAPTTTRFESLFPCLAWFRSLPVLQAPALPAGSVSGLFEQLRSAEH